MSYNQDTMIKFIIPNLPCMFKTVPLVLLCLMMLSCEKEKTEKKTLDYTLTYEVITTGGTWFGEYNDSTGKKVPTIVSLPNGWKYTFRLHSLPFDMHIGATTSCGCQATPDAPDVTINFYSNGELFKTSTNTWAKGVASLDFHMQ